MSTLLRVLNTSHSFQQPSTKHKEMEHTRSLLSLCAISRSATKTSMSDISLPPVPLTYPHHLRKPRVGSSSLRICISIGKDHLVSKRGSGSAMAALRQVVPGVRSKQGICTLACQSISSKCWRALDRRGLWSRHGRKGIGVDSEGVVWISFDYYHVLCTTDEVSSSVSV